MRKTSEVYQNLYHYTDQKGLEGILKSQSFWATHYKYLNDQKEIILFMEEVLSDILRPELEKVYLDILYSKPAIRDRFLRSQDDLGEVIKEDTDILIDSMFKALKDEIYITSFCGETGDPNIDNHGLLSQWRAYGTDGGYCIVLDTKKFEDQLYIEYSKHAHMHLSLADVVYSNESEKMSEEFKDYISALVGYIPSAADTIINTYSKKKTYPIPYKEFVSCITRYKHFGFKEEREVRIISHLLPETYDSSSEKRPRKIKNKVGEKCYIDILRHVDDSLPIKKIIVGPHKDKDKRTKYLKKILKDTDIVVTCSEIPYVSRMTP